MNLSGLSLAPPIAWTLIPKILWKCLSSSEKFLLINSAKRFIRRENYLWRFCKWKKCGRFFKKWWSGWIAPGSCFFGCEKIYRNNKNMRSIKEIKNLKVKPYFCGWISMCRSKTAKWKTIFVSKQPCRRLISC